MGRAPQAESSHDHETWAGAPGGFGSAFFVLRVQGLNVRRPFFMTPMRWALQATTLS
jgi:hypothetical protein